MKAPDTWCPGPFWFLDSITQQQRGGVGLQQKELFLLVLELAARFFTLLGLLSVKHCPL